MKDLLELPLAIQIALGSGYLAYLIASAGIRQHHTATDAVFRTIAFGLVATAVMLWSPVTQPAKSAVAVASSLVVGAFWRWRGARWAQSLLCWTNVTWSDDIPSAWLSITAIRTDIRPSQIAVDLSDGRTLLCEDVRDFADAPFGPCTFGLDGGVALYVTAERRPDGHWIEAEDVRHAFRGDRITYVPAASITRVELRLWSKSNGRAEQEAAKAAARAEVLGVSEAAPNPEYE